jgi:hypothetical protein
MAGRAAMDPRRAECAVFLGAFFATEGTENSKRSRSSEEVSFRIFGEGNEGNEDPIPTYVKSFVLLVNFCSKI